MTVTEIIPDEATLAEAQDFLENNPDAAAELDAILAGESGEKIIGTE